MLLAAPGTSSSRTPSLSHSASAITALVHRLADQLAVVVGAGVLGVELAVGDVLAEALDVLPVVVHALHAPGEGAAGGEVE